LRTVLDTTMKIFVISRRTAAARRAFARAEMHRSGLAFEFFDAIDSPDEARARFERIDRKRFRLNTRRDPSPGEIGCFASHVSLWQKCKASQQPIVVLEDDFVLTPHIHAALRYAGRVVATYGFIRFEEIERRRVATKRFRPAAHRVESSDGLTLYYMSDVPLSMLAYAISPSAATALIAASRTLIAPVDKFMQKTWLHSVPVFALAPASVALCHLHQPSTIGKRPSKLRGPGLMLSRLIYKTLDELRRIRFDSNRLPQFTEGREARSLLHQRQAPRIPTSVQNTADH
jgi:glycosyl transferase family 25